MIYRVYTTIGKRTVKNYPESKFDYIKNKYNLKQISDGIYKGIGVMVTTYEKPCNRVYEKKPKCYDKIAINTCMGQVDDAGEIKSKCEACKWLARD